MSKCSRCAGKGIIKVTDRDNKIKHIKCPDCLTPDTFEKVIDRSITRCESQPQLKKRLEDLKAIKTFLPDYPIIAVMEAEHRCFSADFIRMMKQAYKILNFGDVEYLTTHSEFGIMEESSEES